jgi:hypothetical protein
MNIDYTIENLQWASKILQKEKNISLMLQGVCNILRNQDNEIRDLKMQCDARTDVTIITVDQIMVLHETINQQKDLLRAAIYCLETSISPDTHQSDIKNDLKDKIWVHLGMGQKLVDKPLKTIQNQS